MSFDPGKPLIVQTDRTLYVEVRHPQFAEVRNVLHTFAELIKSPAYVHTYRLTPLSLWNAAASGWDASQVLQALQQFSKFTIPASVERSIREEMSRFGRFFLRSDDAGNLFLQASTEEDLLMLKSYDVLSRYFAGQIKATGTKWSIQVEHSARGALKQQCIRLGYPLCDEAGYREGEFLPMELRSTLSDGSPFGLRPYQQEAVAAFYREGAVWGGSGLLVLPCGAGKTIIGLATMVKHQSATLILTSNQSSVQQWQKEIVQKTSLRADQVGEYTGEVKQIRPVTVATYNILTYRAQQTNEFTHMHVFQKKNWGLIIYDEVHLLPAPVFRATASIQSIRRLGLTATLIREDGREEDVFSLIGPKRFDVQWKELEKSNYIAKAYCTEVRVRMQDKHREQYYLVPARKQAQLAQVNPSKIDVVKQLLTKHAGASILIMGQYVSQLQEVGRRLNVPVITGIMKQQEREVLYEQFRQRLIPVLAVSKVANFALDLPDASVAIQISGTFGSRQEEAQRLGRIIRPKDGDNKAYFYHIVTQDSKDQEYAAKRQLFLVEQGYHYELLEM